jgi:hypothetical protein
MIEFLAQMPTDTKIFLTMAVLGLATVLGLAYRLRGPSSPRGRDPRVVGGFGVANLGCDLGAGDTRSPACLQFGTRIRDCNLPGHSGARGITSRGPSNPTRGRYT